MAIFESHRAPATGTLSAGVLGGLFNTLFAAFADWQERRATRASLLQLSDRELDDIGLTRGDVEHTL